MTRSDPASEASPLYAETSAARSRICQGWTARTVVDRP